MKIVLASYFQPQYHGSGRKISISGKPSQASIDAACDKNGYESYTPEILFEALSPGDIYWDYKRDRDHNPDAGKIFSEKFKAQLDEFKNAVEAEVKKTGKPIFDILPFQDGDTLLSWENNGNLTFRSTVAEYLRDLGYEVEEN